MLRKLWTFLKNFFLKPSELDHPHDAPPLPPIAPPLDVPAGPLSRFELSVRYVMENEDGVDWDHDHGTYTNNPKDPGGRTIWGIIQTEYEEHLGHRLDEAAMRAMPRSTAMAIYRKKFWTVIHGDEYRFPDVATAIFDTCVNKGLGGCMLILSDALHKHYEVRYGSALVKDVNALEPEEFMLPFEAALERYIARRIEQNPNMEWARRGWTNRARRLLKLVKQ